MYCKDNCSCLATEFFTFLNSHLKHNAMRTILLLHLLVFNYFGVFSQEPVTRTSTVKTESGVALEIKGALFKAGEVPADLPKRNEFKSEEIYRKVVQGYINMNSELVNEAEAKKLGFTMPELVDTKTEQQQREELRQRRVRKEPVSEEEKALKKEKELNKK